MKGLAIILMLLLADGSLCTNLRYGVAKVSTAVGYYSPQTALTSQIMRRPFAHYEDPSLAYLGNFNYVLVPSGSSIAGSKVYPSKSYSNF